MWDSTASAFLVAYSKYEPALEHRVAFLNFFAPGSPLRFPTTDLPAWQSLGYFDQSYLSRDLKRYSDAMPAAFARRQAHGDISGFI
jgi:hypothetical protein